MILSPARYKELGQTFSRRSVRRAVLCPGALFDHQLRLRRRDHRAPDGEMRMAWRSASRRASCPYSIIYRHHLGDGECWISRYPGWPRRETGMCCVSAAVFIASPARPGCALRRRRPRHQPSPGLIAARRKEIAYRLRLRHAWPVLARLNAGGDGAPRWRRLWRRRAHRACPRRLRRLTTVAPSSTGLMMLLRRFEAQSAG